MSSASPTPERLTPARLREIAQSIDDWATSTEWHVQSDELRAHAVWLETQEWQDISTAPKDGTRILAYFPGNSEFPPTIAIAVWRELSPTVNWEAVDVDQELWRRSITTPAFFEPEDGMSIDPTLWMPLPPAPKPPEARSDERD